MQMPSLANAVRPGAEPAIALHLQTGPDSPQGGSEVPRRRTMLRRAADVAVALALLALTGPLMLLTALAVRLDSPGSVLVGLPHLGQGGRVFRLLTFRCSQEAAFGRTAPSRVAALIQPPRIDQLPVLLNLLRGDMTLIGPAPVKVGIALHGAPMMGTPGISGWVGSA